MKILYAAFKYDYADKRRGLSYEHVNFWDTLSRMYGNNAVYFPVDEKIMELGYAGMNKALLDAVEKKEPNILFCNLFTDEIQPKTIKYITEKTKTITVNWFSDDQWRFDNFSRFWAPLFDWIITTDSEAPAKYKKIGYDNVIKTTWAANQHIYKPQKGDLKYDVSFIGKSHGNRKEMVAYLKTNGIKAQCWGQGWPNGRVSQEEMVKIFSQSKINLNFTEVSTAKKDFKTLIKIFAKIFLRRGVNNTFHFSSPSIIWRNIINFHLPQSHPQIKGRNFEVPACGGFLLTEPAEDLFNFYEYEKEIVVFNDLAELIEKITYYLSHEEERKKIAQAGYERTLKGHTWEKRFSEFFDIIQTGGKYRA